jgi:hypothetical protein
MLAISVAAAIVASLFTSEMLARWRRDADLRRRWSERPSRKRRVRLERVSGAPL